MTTLPVLGSYDKCACGNAACAGLRERLREHPHFSYLGAMLRIRRERRNGVLLLAALKALGIERSDPDSVYVAALHYSSQCFSAQKSLLDAVDFVPDAPAAGKRPNLRRFSLLQLYHEVGVSAPPGTTTTSWAPAPLVTVKEAALMLSPRRGARERAHNRDR